MICVTTPHVLLGLAVVAFIGFTYVWYVNHKG